MIRRLLALILCLGISSASVRGQTPSGKSTTASSSSSQSAEYEKRLSAIKNDIDRLRLQLNEEEKREKTVLSQLDRIGVKKRLLFNELKLLQVQLGKTRADRDAIGKSIPEMEITLAADRDRLAQVLIALYKHGRFSVARYALEARDLQTFLTEVRSLGLVAAAQDRLIADFAAKLADLGQADAELKAKETEIAALTEKANAKRVELESEERKDKDLVDQIKTNQKTYEQTIGELDFVRLRKLLDEQLS